MLVVDRFFVVVVLFLAWARLRADCVESRIVIQLLFIYFFFIL